MSKSIVANKKIIKGTKLTMKNITTKSPGGGLDPYKINSIIGRKVNKNIDVDDIILLKHLSK